MPETAELTELRAALEQAVQAMIAARPSVLDNCNRSRREGQLAMAASSARRLEELDCAIAEGQTQLA